MGYIDDSSSSSSSSDSEDDQTSHEIQESTENADTDGQDKVSEPKHDDSEDKNVEKNKNLSSLDDNHSLDDVKDVPNQTVAETDLPIVMDSQESSLSSSPSSSDSEPEDILSKSETELDLGVGKQETEKDLSELPMISDNDDNPSLMGGVGSSVNYEPALKTDSDVETTILPREDSSSHSSSSSSESETEEEGQGGPLVVRQNYDSVPGTSLQENTEFPDNGSSSDDSIALALKTALQEREKELQQSRDLENDIDKEIVPRSLSKAGEVMTYSRTTFCREIYVKSPPILLLHYACMLQSIGLI